MDPSAALESNPMSNSLMFHSGKLETFETVRCSWLFNGMGGLEMPFSSKTLRQDLSYISRGHIMLVRGS